MVGNGVQLALLYTVVTELAVLFAPPSPKYYTWYFSTPLVHSSYTMNTSNSDLN